MMKINFLVDKLLSSIRSKKEKTSPVKASADMSKGNMLLIKDQPCSLMSVTGGLLIFTFVLLTGCKGAYIYNIDQAEFSAHPKITISEIQQGIFRGAKRAQWIPKVIAPNQILAMYSYKRNKYSATVMISYDLDSYSITYHSSRNLKYKKIPPRTDGSTNFFTENNPFEPSYDAVQNQSNATIHKRYNQWVSILNQEISQELNALPIATHYSKKSTNTVITKTKDIACTDQPEEEFFGQATVVKSRVNIRNGAGTRCAIVGTVSKGDKITLLGKKNNWYFIDTGNKQAWIYTSLVKTLTEEQPEAPVVTINQEPLQVEPTKRITIAVIRFKTLNKEAQKIALGELVSETFTTALVNSRSFKIIEREQLDKVVKEIEMNQTGFIETTDAVEIGKILHADAIITGSVALLGGQIQLNARIIEVESAYVISADTRTTQYTLRNITTIANQIVRKLSHKLINAKQQ